jgi:glycosyltransferase involved in cell wall biosynthesis
MSLGIKHRVHFTGMLSGDLKWGAIYSAEVLALPSHQENFGVAVAEALGCGKPVLISNRVNIWREVAIKKAGLVGPDTLDGCGSILGEWLTLGADDYQLMKVRARELFVERFEIKKMASTLSELIWEAQARERDRQHRR